MKIKEKKYFSKYKKPLIEVPDLVENQVNSYEGFLHGKLQKTIMEFSPIEDYSGKKYTLSFKDFSLEDPEHDEHYARSNKLTFQGKLSATIQFENKITGEVKEDKIFLTEIPYMTPHGTFIINGVERVIVPQLARSYGVFFTMEDTPKGNFFGAKIIPARGAWIEFGTSKDGVVYVRIDKKRKFPATMLLKIFGLETNEDILEAFADDEVTLKYIKETLAKDTTLSKDEAYVDIYRKLRDGEIASVEALRGYFESLFGEEMYDLSEVGRYHFNKRFGLPLPKKNGAYQKTLNIEDLILIFKYIAKLNEEPGSKPDDIDHLGARRIRFVGELIEQKVRQALSQMRRNIRDRMSTADPEEVDAVNLINQRPFQARIKEFFATNQLSQFMDQENVLSEISHLRTISALGPGGLTRERAGFEVRDVQPSHYGRVCPINTPEGPNIGLVLRLAIYSKINHFGMIEAPYAKVEKGKLTGEIVYLNALDEEKHKIAHASNKYDEKKGFLHDLVEVRHKGKPALVPKKEVEFMDVATNMAFSVATSLIPFLEADNANRALMGSNMMKQAVPCVVQHKPLVATGMEEYAALNTGRGVISRSSGKVI